MWQCSVVTGCQTSGPGADKLVYCNHPITIYTALHCGPANVHLRSSNHRHIGKSNWSFIQNDHILHMSDKKCAIATENCLICSHSALWCAGGRGGGLLLYCYCLQSITQLMGVGQGGAGEILPVRHSCVVTSTPTPSRVIL